MIRLVWVVMVFLCACSEQQPMLRLEPPEPLRQISAFAEENLFALVKVNDGSPQRLDDRVWSAPVNGILRGRENTVSIAWYEEYAQSNLLLARQRQTFFVSTTTAGHTVVTDYESDGADFDCDNDGTSNLVERRVGTDPCSGMLLAEPDMVLIEAGCFDMGSPLTEAERELDEGPQQNVCVTGFEMSRNESTFSEYDAFTTATSITPADDFGFGRGNRPALVSWIDATAYAVWLSGATGKRYRLPTEAEWEYAARAGTTSAFSTGELIQPNQANYDTLLRYNGSRFELIPFNKPVVVGLYEPNPFGLFDMHGNVGEWTCSQYDSSYQGRELVCTDGNAGSRVSRGGTWFAHPKFLRSANRNQLNPDFRDSSVGFRLVRDL